VVAEAEAMMPVSTYSQPPLLRIFSVGITGYARLIRLKKILLTKRSYKRSMKPIEWQMVRKSLILRKSA
jgi:hypothetical protein